MTDEDKSDVLRNQSLSHKNRESADIPGMRNSYLLVDFTSSMHLYISMIVKRENGYLTYTFAQPFSTPKDEYI